VFLAPHGAETAVFHASLPALEVRKLPAPAAQAIYKKADLLARGKRGGHHTLHCLPHPELHRTGISSISVANL
jgi:hypothetical protein